MLTTRTARWSAVTGLVCVIVLVTTWFVLVGPRRSEAADLGDQQASAEAANVSLQAQINTLREQFGDLEKTKDELADIRSQMPPAADVANVVRAISDRADDAGVEIVAVTPGGATTLRPATGTTPAVVAIPVTIDATGRYVENALFLRYLQNMKRRYLVYEVNLGSGDAGGSVTANTTAATTASPTTTPSTPASATTTATTTTSTTTSTSTATTTGTPSDEYTLTVTGMVFSLVDPASAAPSATATPAPSATATP